MIRNANTTYGEYIVLIKYRVLIVIQCCKRAGNVAVVDAKYADP